MAGTNPDPAETLPVLEIITGLFQDQGNVIAQAVVEAAQKLVPSQGASEYGSRVIGLTPGQPLQILGYDRQRVRALIRASTTDVFIGTMSDLQSGFGYPIATGSGDEVKTIEEVFVRYNPSGAADLNARVSVWSERNPG